MVTYVVQMLSLAGGRSSRDGRDNASRERTCYIESYVPNFKAPYALSALNVLALEFGPMEGCIMMVIALYYLVSRDARRAT
ncbi:hypothetical protein TWF481_005977 [Arthrobotrys musiformis]|uniref:Uncharacterized protein n=1 Tax=Arthrobotrys musiformis TaxID=47236 RepID=A0AAV9WGJ1_9PEZI